MFEGDKIYGDMGITVEAPNLKWPKMVAPEGPAAVPGERRVCVSHTRVRRPKYGGQGGGSERTW